MSQPPQVGSFASAVKRLFGQVAEASCYPCEGMPGCGTLSIGVRCIGCDVPVCNQHAAFFPLTGSTNAMCPLCIRKAVNEAEAETSDEPPRRGKRRPTGEKP